MKSWAKRDRECVWVCMWKSYTTINFILWHITDQRNIHQLPPSSSPPPSSRLSAMSPTASHRILPSTTVKQNHQTKPFPIRGKPFGFILSYPKNISLISLIGFSAFCFETILSLFEGVRNNFELILHKWDSLSINRLFHGLPIAW